MSVEVCTYDSPLGAVLLAADGQGLSGLWFEGQTHFGEFGSTRNALPADVVERGASRVIVEAISPECSGATRALLGARVWLDAYFAGEPLPESPELHLEGTPFQRRVWQLLLEIPYGRSATYGELARRLESRFGARTSPRAIGGAVGRNPVSIIVPCHRVLGAHGAITGYAGGLERKRALLALEGAAHESRTPARPARPV